MLSLYEILKASKTGIAPDMWTALAGMNWGGKDSGAKVKELTGIPPLSFTADGTPLLDYLISGNMTQTGTPTPNNPIMPEGTGERTGNLFDGILFNGIYRDANFNIMTNSSNVYKCCKIYLDSGTYTMSFTKAVNIVRLLINGTYTENVEVNVMTYTFTVNNDSYFGITFRDSTSSSTVWDNSPIMLNESSTALPYEPYGYKLTISSANTTTLVYLGEVETTRKIKKLVLTGDEAFTNQYGANLFSVLIQPLAKMFPFSSYCTHYKYNPVQSGLDANTQNGDFALQLQSTQTLLAFKDTAYSSATDFKSYLAQQYANGTPVTVWYVLATEETGVVNEPIRKIGEYVDTLSMEQAGVSIPTNNGSTTVDVETTLKPSEVYIKWKGV